ncbi:LLM class flavin-dependent oxidoreductase [Bacillus cereus]|uniref:LLM class flavin-dependent oxidoreductase n=1 Tax=Bacillus cereus TaxID=1396 RepID=UPI001CFED260
MKSNVSFYSEIPSEMSKEGKYDSIEKICNLSEKYGFTGSLIYYFNDALDPWTLATKVINTCENLIPLIAVQPYYVSPYTTAKIVKSIAALYNRKVNLNFVTGINTSDLTSLGEITDPAKKFNRMQEYINIYSKIINSKDKVSFEGTYYNYHDLYSGPSIDNSLIPEIFIPGSSQESIDLALKVADTALIRPQPYKQFIEKYLTNISHSNMNFAIRISIIARPSQDEAWKLAERRFKRDRRGEITTVMRSNSLSHNARTMASLALTQEKFDDVYWMGGFLSGKTEDPYLVGSYSDVANYLNLYRNAGVNTFLIGNVSDNEEEVEHIAEVMRLVNNC